MKEKALVRGPVDRRDQERLELSLTRWVWDHIWSFKIKLVKTSLTHGKLDQLSWKPESFKCFHTFSMKTHFDQPPRDFGPKSGLYMADFRPKIGQNRAMHGQDKNVEKSTKCRFFGIFALPCGQRNRPKVYLSGALLAKGINLRPKWPIDPAQNTLAI